MEGNRQIKKDNFQQDITLKFYQQRKRQSRNIKQHTLLQRNVSYFQQIDQKIQKSLISQQPTQPSYHDKQNYQRNQSTQPQKTIQRPRFLSVKVSSQTIDSQINYQPTNLIHKQVELDKGRKILFNYQPFKKSLQGKESSQSQNIEAFKTPQFQHNQINNKITKQNDNNLEQQLKQKLQIIRDLEKKLKTQNKFIDSIQKMRKTLQNVESDCSIHQLWQWIKKLPRDN